MRFPQNKSDQLTAGKLLIAENHGRKGLGKEIALAPVDTTYGKREADNDGDQVHLFEVGERGISQKVYDRVLANAKENGVALIDMSSTKDPGTPATINSLYEQAKTAALGNDAVTSSQSVARVIGTAESNNIRVVVS